MVQIEWIGREVDFHAPGCAVRLPLLEVCQADRGRTVANGMLNR